MTRITYLDLVVAHVHMFAAADNVAVRQRAREGGRVDAEKRGDEFDLVCEWWSKNEIIRGGVRENSKKGNAKMETSSERAVSSKKITTQSKNDSPT